ncbi:MAG: HAMP domain-containing sensor histidine kinase [Nitrosomonas ureae]
MKDRVSREIAKTKMRFLGASVLLLCAAIALSIIWNRSIKEELASQATSFIRKGMISTDMRGVSESLSGIQLSSFESVTLFHPSGQRILTLPPVFDYRDRSQSLWHTIIYDTISTGIYVDREMKDNLGTLVFSYSRFELVRYAVLFWVFAAIALWQLLSPATRKVEAEIQKEIRLRNAAAIEEIAKKIRHNIRSPLAVLNALFLDRTLDRETFFEQGHSAVRRLEEIVAEIKSDFQKAPKTTLGRPPIYEISKLIGRIVAEKQVIAKDIEIRFTCDDENAPVYCELPASELKATLSNLIDNSLQAIDGKGQIMVRLECDEHSVFLEVIDSGRGIPKDMLQHAFEKGFSYDKEGGTGLGLFYAKKLVEEHQGNIEIRSREGSGTTVALDFPRQPTPNWHISSLNLAGIENVVVCDDVPGIRKAWDLRLKALLSPPRIMFYGACEAIPAGLKSALYLMDYDFGYGRETGLEFARRLTAPDRLVLVTGNFDAPEIQEACANVGCKLLPKDEIAQVQII